MPSAHRSVVGELVKPRYRRSVDNEDLLLIDVYKNNPREKVEKIIKNERPLVKRFASKAYDGEFSELPLRVAGVVTEYIEESL